MFIERFEELGEVLQNGLLHWQSSKDLDSKFILFLCPGDPVMLVLHLKNRLGNSSFIKTSIIKNDKVDFDAIRNDHYLWAFFCCAFEHLPKGFALKHYIIIDKFFPPVPISKQIISLADITSQKLLISSGETFANVSSFLDTVACADEDLGTFDFSDFKASVGCDRISLVQNRIIEIPVVPSITTRPCSIHQQKRFNLEAAKLSGIMYSHLSSHMAKVQTPLCVTEFFLYIAFLARKFYQGVGIRNIYINGHSGIGKSATLLSLAAYLRCLGQKLHLFFMADASNLVRSANHFHALIQELIFSFKPGNFRNFLSAIDISSWASKKSFSRIIDLVGNYLDESEEIMIIIVDQVCFGMPCMS